MDPFVKSYVFAEFLCLTSFGVHGLVLFLGGASADTVTPVVGYGTTLSTVTFDKLVFYDPKRQERYPQTTTGENPSRRLHHCAVTVQGQNATEM